MTRHVWICFVMTRVGLEIRKVNSGSNCLPAEYLQTSSVHTCSLGGRGWGAGGEGRGEKKALGRLCTCSHSLHQSPRLQATALSAQELLSQKELVAHALALFCLGKTSAFSAQLSRLRCHSGACVQFNSLLALVCVGSGPPAPGKPPRIATWATKTSTHGPLTCLSPLWPESELSQRQSNLSEEGIPRVHTRAVRLCVCLQVSVLELTTGLVLTA